MDRTKTEAELAEQASPPALQTLADRPARQEGPRRDGQIRRKAAPSNTRAAATLALPGASAPRRALAAGTLQRAVGNERAGRMQRATGDNRYDHRGNAILGMFAEAQERYGQVQHVEPAEQEVGAANLDEPSRIPELESGYDPTWEPEGHHRLPARNRGEWITGVPGDGRWQPYDPGAYGLARGQSVLFVEGVPDFTEYAVETPSGQPGTFEVQGLTGDPYDDYTNAISALAAQEGMLFQECHLWLTNNSLRLHHFSGNEMQIVPERLHGALGHQGSAVEMRS